MSGWEFVNHRPNGYAVINRTGGAAHNVRLRASGGFLVGMVGQRNWESKTVEQLPDGQRIEFTAQRVASDARLQVTWTSGADDDHRQMTTFKP